MGEGRGERGGGEAQVDRSVGADELGGSNTKRGTNRRGAGSTVVFFSVCDSHTLYNIFSAPFCGNKIVSEAAATPFPGTCWPNPPFSDFLEEAKRSLHLYRRRLGLRKVRGKKGGKLERSLRV